MRTWLLISLFGLAGIVYFLASYYQFDFLFNPQRTLTTPNTVTFLLGFSLLAADAFLPTPSSAVMVAGGYLFGSFGGMLLAVTGLMAGNALGYLAARWGRDWLERKFPTEKRGSTQHFWQRWGAIALIISRPVPVLAESILFLSATTNLGFLRVMAYCCIGTVPTALFYVAIGIWGSN